MINVKREVNEARRRDKKRRRLILSIGERQVHITREEAGRLARKLARFALPVLLLVALLGCSSEFIDLSDDATEVADNETDGDGEVCVPDDTSPVSGHTTCGYVCEAACWMLFDADRYSAQLGCMTDCIRGLVCNPGPECPGVDAAITQAELDACGVALEAGGSWCGGRMDPPTPCFNADWTWLPPECQLDSLCDPRETCGD